MHDLLTTLTLSGVQLQLQGDALHITGPAHALTPSLRDALQQHKPALIDSLRRLRDQPAPAAPAPALKPAPDDRHQPFPLTDVQHAYWLGRQGLVELGQVSTHFYFELDTEDLDLARLEQALQRVIERHDMLRAVVQGDGLQRVLPQVPPYRIELDDVSALDDAQAQARLLATREALSHRVHRADQWPLFAVRATRRSTRALRLHVSLDMLVMDAWSMFTLFREWQQFYTRPDSDPPALALSYRDCVLAGRQLLGSPTHEQDRRYWLDRIGSLPMAPQLPLRSGGIPPGTAPRFTRRRARIDAARWSRLLARARDSGLTPSGLLLAVFADVLTRWSAAPHYTLNLTLCNRPPLHAQVNAVIGDFTSLTMLEVDHRGAAGSFSQRAAGLQQRLMTDLEHRSFNGVQVLREWAQHRQAGLVAAMPVVFTSALALGGGTGQDESVLEAFGPLVYGLSQTPQVWLDHQVFESRGELVFNWDAVEAVFEPGVLDAMFEAQRALLVRLADDDAAWHRTSLVSCASDMLAPAQRAAVERDAAPPRLLHQGLLDQARQRPGAPALIAADRTLSYHALLAESAAVAQWLRAQGLQPGQLVAVVMHKGWEQAVAVLGTLLAGGAYLPVDAHLPIQRQQELLQIGQVRHVLAQPAAAGPSGPVGGIRRPAWPASCAVLEVATPNAAAQPAIDPVPISPDALAYVIFTSGTSGQPKGVMISHQAAWNTIAHVNAMLGLTPADRILGVSSLSFDLSVYDLFGTLAAGAALVLPDARRHLDATHWNALIAQHRVSVWNSAPQLMRMLVEAAPHAPGDDADTLRAVMLSGDWIPLDLPDRVRARHRQARVISLGGATEASIWSIGFPIDAVEPGWASIPYGRALPGQTVSVRNHRLEPCPARVRGRLYIGGAGLADGYWADPQRTAQQFITCPATGERLYDTGDIGRYLDDGLIELLGRDDEQVKIRGHRVEPAELAAVLCRHPEVQAAVVRAVGPPQDRQLAAYVQLADGPSGLLGQRHTAEAPPLGTLLAPAPGSARPLTARLQSLWARLDDYHLAAVTAALRRFGFGRAGGVLSAPALMAHGVAERYQRWLLRAFDALCSAGLLQQAGPQAWRIVSDWAEPDLAGLSREIDARLRETLHFSDAEARWLTRSAEQLPDILTERVHSAAVYAADASPRLYQRLFPDSHAQLAQVMQALVRQRAGGLSIIELGAGWGSATRHALPALRSGDRYLFTDVSAFFLQRAQRLQDEQPGLTHPGLVHPGLAFARFDADQRPEWQGLARHSFDVVLAASMLHDVRDIRAALDNVIGLLKPAGQLVLLEETRFFRSFDLHMGLQQGFDAATDTALRPVHALLSVPQWEQVLAEAGFTDVHVLQAPGTAMDHLGFHVIVATGPLQTCTLDAQAVREHLRSRLPEPMVPRHVVQMARFPVTANGKLDLEALPAVPEQAWVEARQVTAPRNDLERLVLTCWAACLPGLNEGRDVDVFDSFFDRGGDSLLATQLVAELARRTGCTVELHQVLEHKTVAAMAALIEAQQAGRC